METYVTVDREAIVRPARNDRDAIFGRRHEVRRRSRGARTVEGKAIV